MLVVAWWDKICLAHCNNKTGFQEAYCPLATTRYQHWWGGPQVNKFEQVSSDDHQIPVGPMSIDGKGGGSRGGREIWVDTMSGV